MSKIVSLEEFRRNRINKKITDIKVKDYNQVLNGYLLDVAECLEEGDNETLLFLCRKHGLEFMVTAAPVEFPQSNYSIIINLDPLATNFVPDEIAVFCVHGDEIIDCFAQLAEELKLYYNYLIERGE